MEGRERSARSIVEDREFLGGSSIEIDTQAQAILLEVA